MRLPVLLLCCAVLWQDATADTNDCVNPAQHYLYWVQEYFDLADAVFLGKVVAEETPRRRTSPAAGPSSPAGASSMAELLEMIEAGQASAPPPDRLQSATFQIEKSWKGPAGPAIAVKARLHVDDTGYHAALSAGDSYLVFAFSTDDEGIFYIPVGCAAHESAADLDAKTRVLDALTKKPGDR